MSHLAQELIYLILDEADSQADLKTWTLVSRTFVSPGQRRLFRSLTLTTHTIVRLCRNLSQSPHIGSYVRDLRLNLPIRPDDIQDIQTPLTKTIQLFSQVTRVAISAPAAQPWLFWSWNSCSEELKAALIALFSLPTMHSLALVRCSRVPAAIIFHALASYEYVVLQVANIDSENQKIDLLTPRQNKPLKHIVLLDYSPTATPDVHALLLRPEMKAASEHLRHLEITVPASVHTYPGLDIISEYAPFLQHLTVTFYRRTSLSVFHDQSGFRAIPPINLPALPALRSMNLRADLPPFVGIPDSLLLFIAGLSSLTPDLEVLDLILNSVTPRFANTPYPSAPAADEALIRLHSSNLREVRFMVTASGSPSPYPDKHHAVYSEMKNKLPRTSTAAILLFPKNIPQRLTPWGVS